MTAPDRRLVEALRQACLEAAVSAYEDAGIRGLCPDGRWDYAVDAIRALDLDAVVRRSACSGSTAAETAAPAPAANDSSGDR